LSSGTPCTEAGPLLSCSKVCYYSNRNLALLVHHFFVEEVFRHEVR
jgi:hypothetical protein